MLKYYVDFSSPEGLDPSHNDWIGAWWTGFIMAGIIAVLSAIPLIMFPRKLPEADKVMTMKIAQGLASPEVPDDEKQSNMTLLEMAKDFWWVPLLRKVIFRTVSKMLCTVDCLIMFYNDYPLQAGHQGSLLQRCLYVLYPVPGLYWLPHRGLYLPPQTSTDRTKVSNAALQVPLIWTASVCKILAIY